MTGPKRPESRRIRQSPKLPAATRQDQLVNAAQALFIKKGYRATTTEEIAHLAGLTKGALYFHFKSKEAIFSEILKRALDQFAAAFEPVSDRRLSPKDVLMLLRRIDAHRHMPKTRHSMDLRAEVLKLPRIKAHVNKKVRKTIDFVASCLDPTYARTMRERRDLANLIFSFYDGVTLRKLMSPDLINVDRQIRLFVSLFETTKEKVMQKPWRQ